MDLIVGVFLVLLVGQLVFAWLWKRTWFAVPFIILLAAGLLWVTWERHPAVIIWLGSYLVAVVVAVSIWDRRRKRRQAARTP